MLKKDIKDPRFVNESKTYGINLIQHVVQTDEVKSASKELVVETLCRDQRVIAKEVELLKYFILHPESIEITKVMMTNVMLRSEILSVLAQQTSRASYTGIQGNQFRA
jgi:hypothetical protein